MSLPRLFLSIGSDLVAHPFNLLSVGVIEYLLEIFAFAGSLGGSVG